MPICRIMFMDPIIIINRKKIKEMIQYVGVVLPFLSARETYKMYKFSDISYLDIILHNNNSFTKRDLIYYQGHPPTTPLPPISK